jgi:hypothetical protein
MSTEPSSAEFYNVITDSGLAGMAGVVEDSTMLDAAIDGLTTHMKASILRFADFSTCMRAKLFACLLGKIILSRLSANARKPRAVFKSL